MINTQLSAAFLLLVMAVTVSGVAVMMYPILMQDADTKVKEGLSIWYVGTRIAEGTSARVLEQLLCMRWWLQWSGRVPK